MTTATMPSSLREEIVKIALREVCVTLLVDDQPDASRLKECAVAIAEAGAAAYAATIPKEAESNKRPFEESLSRESNLRQDAICSFLQGMLSSIDNIDSSELAEQLSKAYCLGKKGNEGDINLVEFYERVEENFLQARQGLQQAEDFFRKLRHSGVFAYGAAYSKKSTDDLTAYIIRRFLKL